MKLSRLLAFTAAPFALFAASPALADDEIAVAASATTTAEGSGPALWKVADEDTTIYLFGTVHVLPKEIEWYDATIAEALNASDSIVTEIRMDSEAEAEMQQLTMAMGLLPPGTTLRSLLTPEQTSVYEGALAKLGAPPQAFDAFKPWLAGITLAVLPLMQQGYSPDSGVEKVLLSKVPEKPRDALETAEFQFGIFDGMPQDAQITFMMEAAAGSDELKPTLDRMVANWVKGDAVALAEVMNEGLTDPAVAEALLYSRNANWAEWISTRLDTPGTVFIAVGAGHLAGANSVQDYLDAKGITVSRVK